MLIDLHCPLELLAYEILRDDRGSARAYLRLGNLGKWDARRAEGVVIWRGKSGVTRRTRLSAAVDGPNARGAFTVPATVGNLPDAERVFVRFTRVCFRGQADWQGGGRPLTQVPDLPPPDGRELNRLRAVAGPDAANYPFRSSRVWICVCGRANPARRNHCKRCERERGRVLADFAPQAVLRARVDPRLSESVDIPLLSAASDPSASAEAAARSARKLYARFKRQSVMLIRRTVTMLILALILLSVAVGTQSCPAREATPEHRSIPPTRIEAE